MFDWILLDFGITDEDIAETTEDIGMGILERLMPSWEVVVFPSLSPFVVTTGELVLVVAVEKLLVVVVVVCLEA